MKRYIVSLLALLIVLPAYSQQGEPILTYTIDYKTENNCNAVMVYLNSGITIDWGNGKTEAFLPESENATTLSYTFPANGEYTVNVYGASDAIKGMELYDDTDINSITVGKDCKIESFIYCYGVSHLDVSKAEALKTLYFSNSRLSQLDVSGNPYVEYIDVYANPIAKDKIALLNMVESLPDRTGKEPGTLAIDMGNFPRHKAICERKNWIIK